MRTQAEIAGDMPVGSASLENCICVPTPLAVLMLSGDVPLLIAPWEAVLWLRAVRTQLCLSTCAEGGVERHQREISS